MLLRAQRPVIWAGGGAAQASDQILRLAESLEAPVLTTATGKGTLPDTHPLALGAIAAQHPAVWEYLSGCDLVLVVGSKLGPNDTAGWKLPLPETLVHVDLDPGVIGRSLSGHPGHRKRRAAGARCAPAKRSMRRAASGRAGPARWPGSGHRSGR